MQALEVAFGQVDSMRVHRTPAEQAEVRVDIEIARVVRIKRRDPFDFGAVFRDVRLQVRTGRFVPQRRSRFELRWRRRGGEPRRNGIGQPSAMMPALDQRLAVVVALLRRVEEISGRIAVHQDLAGDDPHPAP